MARLENRVMSAPVPLSAAFPVWVRIALLSFGGPAGQIALMHRVLVEEKRWISDARFLHALNYCMLLPGPEAQQLTTYVGWLMHGVGGGLMAGGLFVLPGAVAILALSVIYVLLGHVGLVAGLFFGLKAAVLAIVLQALIRLAKRALRGPAQRALAACAFVAIFFFAAPFPVIVLAAGLIGFVGARAGWPAFAPLPTHAPGAAAPGPTALGEAPPPHAARSRARAPAAAALWLALWLAPAAALWLWAGPDDVFTRLALFFSRMALVTFGGAYAVLAYVAQQAVETEHWLKPGEMLDGLGMAETTPGPLIMVLQFVGFLAAYRAPGALSPLLAGCLGGLVTVWATFLPCFVWIFVGAPFIEQWRGARALSGAMSAIAAAVVGVIANLAVWFSIHVIFARTLPVAGLGLSFEAPDVSSLNLRALALSAFAMLALFRFRADALLVLAGCAAAGAALEAGGLTAAR